VKKGWFINPVQKDCGLQISSLTLRSKKLKLLAGLITSAVSAPWDVPPTDMMSSSVRTSPASAAMDQKLPLRNELELCVVHAGTGFHSTSRHSSFRGNTICKKAEMRNVSNRSFLAHRPSFRSRYIHPTLKMGLVEGNFFLTIEHLFYTRES
jgi:hypothetical protein